MTVALVVVGVLVLAALAAAGLQSLAEREQRAARILLALALGLSLPFFLATLLPAWVGWVVLGLAALVVAVALVLFLLPIGRADWGDDEPQTRLDERNIMFARARLEPGSENYEAYYAMRPENKAVDDRTRMLPGLLSPLSSAFHELAFASTDGSFNLTEALREAVDGVDGEPLAGKQASIDADTMSRFVKDLSVYYGARTAGITDLKPYHLYSHIGRGSGTYGAPVDLDHPYAIAFTVEMSLEMVATAPYAATAMESARQYVEAARVSVQLANAISLLGYRARAHIDGNYRVVAPLVARDAGLGEVGRMGLLMAPDLGPRVRLGVVTTDLPLVPDGRRRDASVLDFCRLCAKCASCCPPHAIPAGDREEIDGVLRWQINDAICFRYWNAVGTDCARCMSVCPYSHPDNWLHNVVRWAVRRSGAARRAAVWLDDAFYGRLPEPKPFPAWIPFAPEKNK